MPHNPPRPPVYVRAGTGGHVGKIHRLVQRRQRTACRLPVDERWPEVDAPDFGDPDLCAGCRLGANGCPTPWRFAHPDRLSANVAASRLAMRTTARIGVYRCAPCAGFHVRCQDQSVTDLPRDANDRPRPS